jgi:hypothetical protein
MRHFDDRVEFFAEECRRQPVTQEAWRPRPDLGTLHTASGPFWVSATLVGVAKPIKPHPCPFAAHEKIASDLAYDLALPVAPVTLWDRGVQANGDCQFVAISAVPFSQPREWGKINGDPTLSGLTNSIRQRMRPVMSAMCVFDAWVHNTDHDNHPGNLLVSADPDQTLPLRLAYIDYSYSMIHSWPHDEWNAASCPPPYDRHVPVDMTVLQETAQRIQALPTATIREVVERIPPEFVNDADRAKLITALLDRQRRITEILRTRHAI